MIDPARSLRVLPCLLALAAVAACGGEQEPASPAPTVSATTAAPGGSATPTAGATATAAPDDAQVVAITVAGDEVTGVEPRTQVPLGTRVRLTITSDTADEVHVHGYDLRVPVSAGQAAQLEFEADVAGLFEVELHDSGTVLTRLQVR